jgi:hypothetical protein
MEAAYVSGRSHSSLAYSTKWASLAPAMVGISGTPDGGQMEWGTAIARLIA